MTHLLCQHFSAGQDAVAAVLAAPVDDDGRSEWQWVRLANGDLLLGVYPRGDTYFDVEAAVDADWSEAVTTGEVSTITHDPQED